jgi:hypothetical protein
MTEPIASFLMVVPPGWARLPAQEADRAALRTAVDAIVAEALPDTLPRDSAEPHREELRRRLVASVVEAGDAGATGVMMPIRPVHGYTPPVSVIESEIEDGSDEDPALVIAGLLADAGAEDGLREVDGGLAARTETTVRGVSSGEDMPVVDDRQVVYSIPVPHRPGRWVLMSFSAISQPGSDPRVTDALVTLFDALMTTFRWTDVPGAEPTTLERRLEEIRDHAEAAALLAADQEVVA